MRGGRECRAGAAIGARRGCHSAVYMLSFLFGYSFIVVWLYLLLFKGGWMFFFFFFCWYVTVFIVSDICLFRICIYFINLFCCCHCSASRWEMLVAAGHLGSGIFGQLE